MKTLFINGSPNADGNTAALAEVLLADKPYETVNLGTTKVYGYGQPFASDSDDRFAEVLEKMRAAELIVFGSPVYWHNLSGILRNLLDRCYGPLERGGLAGKKIAFVFQGEAPTREMLSWGEYTMSRFAGLYGAEYVGMASNSSEAKKLAENL